MIEKLKKVNIFKNLSDELLNEILKIAQIKEFKKGDIICEEGEDGNEMFIILGGEIEISKNLVGKNKKVLTILEKDNFFGELSFFDNKKRSANAIALSDAILLVIEKERFEKLLENDPALAAQFYKNVFLELSKRIRNLNKSVQDRILWSFSITQ
ncbi:MAG TPA: cyclic nucleotide-binding domain-containing protein [bacterium]|nr:cyclic nucleotide-binding domain-containing protein [bacterium]HOL47870.1 cyclic nucleotide-binding domain-containing protein [bacterium]HPQ18505.1 cyclic nucleotide-binding domain-containing protein [bacterium]